MINFMTLVASVSLMIAGCNRSEQKIQPFQQVNLYKDLDSINKKYCFDAVKDSLIESNVVKLSKQLTTYDKFDKDVLLNDKRLQHLFRAIEEFDEITVFSGFYLMRHSSSEYLIMIGQAAGATGIGVDYWNYRCYALESDLIITDFHSLVKTPFSFYSDNQNKLHYIIIEGNSSAATPGNEEGVDNTSLRVSLFNTVGIEAVMDFPCKYNHD